MWQTLKISDVCTIKGRIGYRGYTKRDLVGPEEGAISLSPSNIISNKINFTKNTYISWEKYYESPEIMLEIDDIVFCKTASIGKLAIVEDLPVETTLNPQFVVLKNISCDNRFLYYAIQSPSFSSQISGIIGGTAIPTLSQKNLGELVISLPPLSEQQRIVAKLDAAFAEIEGAIEVVETKMIETEKLKFALLDASLNSDNLMLNAVRLGDVCHKITDGSHNPPKGVESSEYLMLSSKNVHNDRISYEKPRFLSKSDFEDENKRTDIQMGDVLLTIVGTIGRCAVFEEMGDRFTLQRSVAVLKPKHDLVLSRFMMFVLQSMLEVLNDGARGVAQKGIYLKSLKALPFLLPPLAEQQRIVAKLDAASSEFENANESIIKCKANYLALKSAILAQELQSEAA